jgi:hypothetical protein
LADQLDAECVFVVGSSRFLPVRYVQQLVQTTRLLLEWRPRAVVIMQPPLFALLPAALLRLCTRARVVGDLHSGTFNDPKWSWASKLVLGVIGRRGLSMVTSETFKRRVESAGGAAIVVHDRIERVAPSGDAMPSDVVPQLMGVEYVLFPFTYAADEPIWAVIDAAKLVPDVTLVMTGRAPAELRNRAPENVIFSGYVSNVEYAVLAASASCICALTSRENTMQRAAYEALAFGRPLVTSGTEVLRDYFGDSAVYTDNSAVSMAGCLRRVLDNRRHYERAAVELAEIRNREQGVSISLVRDWMHSDQ